MSHIRFSLITYSFIYIIAFIDVLLDWEGMGRLNVHILVEITMGFIALGAFIYLFISSLKQNKQLKNLTLTLSDTQNALSQSQQQAQKLMGDLSKIIQAQFDQWQLSNSEKEVGLLLLKGLTLEEIASVRETKEKTVRQQASNLYKKAGLNGRHELVAYFFEDLLVS